MTDTKTLALVAEVERLTRELAAAKQDAERYRWIRGKAKDADYDYYRIIDEAIDAAMRRTDAGAVDNVVDNQEDSDIKGL